MEKDDNISALETRKARGVLLIKNMLKS